MEKRKQYCGLDVLKFVMAVFVAARHMIQVFYAADSRWRLLVGQWLSNLAVPVFFIMAGFLLFRKIPDRKNSSQTVFRYCLRILKLYLLWCVLYWPIDLYNWYHGTASIRETVVFYIRSFFFSHTIAQLWYLPALLVACLVVWALYRIGFAWWQILVLTGMLFVVGCLGDNYFYTERMPMKFQEFIWWYAPKFFTMRNGLFYGCFYVAVGLAFARDRLCIPRWAAIAGSFVFAYGMYREVRHCDIANMAFFAAPAAVCMVRAALSVTWNERALYPGLRSMSEWIYLSHFYFFYFFSWTAHWYPAPLSEGKIAGIIFTPMLLFAFCMTLLAKKEQFRWIRKLI